MLEKNKDSMNILKERTSSGIEHDLAFIEKLDHKDGKMTVHKNIKKTDKEFKSRVA